VDAELALGEPVAEIPDDLALDGVDEVLERFLAFGATEWHEDFASLPDAALAPVLVRSGGRGWLIRATPDGVSVTGADEGAAAAATIAGPPRDLLLWLWRRADTGVDLSGDPELIERIRLVLRDATQ
jgi:hypothetical protein